jgi:hypothetical protein
MKITESEISPEARRFRPDPIRMIILGLAVCSIYGGGILAAVRAGSETVRVAHAGGEVPLLPWILAFIFVVSGMFAVIYAFFFRPREVRITDSLVAVLWWDGNGKAMRREEVEKVKVSGRKIVLKGGGETLTIPPIFLNAKALGEELMGWV